jgi:hypothetical protein
MAASFFKAFLSEAEAGSRIKLKRQAPEPELISSVSSPGFHFRE